MTRKGGSLSNALAKQNKFKIRQIFCDLNITKIEKALEKVKDIEEWVCKYSDQNNSNSAIVYLSVLISSSPNTCYKIILQYLWIKFQESKVLLIH